MIWVLRTKVVCPFPKWVHVQDSLPECSFICYHIKYALSTKKLRTRFRVRRKIDWIFFISKAATSQFPELWNISFMIFLSVRKEGRFVKEPRIIAPNGKINSVSGGGVINASHVRGSGIYRKAHTYKSPTEAHIPSMTTALLKDTLVLPFTILYFL